MTLAAFDGGAYLLPAALTSLVLEIRAAERRADPGSDGSHGPDEAGGATSDDG